MLNELEPGEIDGALATLPPTLNKAYEEIMKRIEKRTGAKKTAIRTLSWILNSGRPLHMDELRELLLIRNGMTKLNHNDLYEPGYILDACQSLVICGKSSGIVRFAHYAVREFLLKDYKQLRSTTDLAIDCLTYLGFDTFEEGPTQYIEARLKNYKAFDYITRYWDSYARDSFATDAESSDEVQRLTLAFLDSDNKRNAMLQVRGNDFTLTKTPLHVLAECGLASICRAVLDRAQNDAQMYTLMSFN